MKVHLKNLVIFVSFIFLINIPVNAELVMWPVIKVGKNIVTSLEVEKYIDAVVLKPEIHAELFKKSGGDFLVYQGQKKKITREIFKETVDQIAAIRVLEAQAIRSQGRRFFGVSKKMMALMVSENINRSLVPFKKKGLSQNEVKELFVDSLISKGLPYRSNSTKEDIFNSWSELVRSQVVESYRQKEALKYLCSLSDCEFRGTAYAFNKFKKLFQKDNFLEIDYGEGKVLSGANAFEALFVNSKLTQNSIETKSDEKTIVYYLGKIEGESVEFVHVNDWNLLGKLGTKLGYPETDDYGRTSGLIFEYEVEGSKGSISVELENWLFTSEVSDTGAVRTQNIEEETAMRIASRQFLDEEGNKWVVVGVALTNKSQKEGVGSWVQKNFHKLNPDTEEKININRDVRELFGQALLGVGGKYSIINHQHINIAITGEVIFLPTVGAYAENGISITSAIEMNLYKNRDDLPVLQISGFASYLLKVDGSSDTSLGAKVSVTHYIKKIKLEVGLFVIRWNGELDREYEGGASWTTGLSFNVAFEPKKTDKDYEFNI